MNRRSARNRARSKRQYAEGQNATMALASDTAEAVKQWREDPLKLTEEQKDTLFVAGNRAIMQRGVAAAGNRVAANELARERARKDGKTKQARAAAAMADSFRSDLKPADKQA